MRKLLITLTVGLALTFGVSQAWAENVDLTTEGSSDTTLSGTGGIAQVFQGEVGSGTGVFPAFVQIGGNIPVTDAYNTTVNNTNDNGSADTHNHEIRVSDLQAFQLTPGGQFYYGFILDINESSGGSPDQSGISLDQIVLITSTTANQSSVPLPAGTTRWNMDGDGDDQIFLQFDEGSGKADMTLFVPVSAFSGALSTDFVYLYSMFGSAGAVNPTGSAPLLNYANSDGFEEWAIKPGGGVITPDGGATAALLGLSMLGLGYLSRRKKQ